MLTNLYSNALNNDKVEYGLQTCISVYNVLLSVKFHYEYSLPPRHQDFLPRSLLFLLPLLLYIVHRSCLFSC